MNWPGLRRALQSGIAWLARALRADPGSSHTRQDALAAVALCAILLLSLGSYLPGLSGPLLLDDLPQLSPILKQVDAGNWRTRAPAFLINPSGPAGRPVAMLSLIAGIVAHGNDISSLKYENVLLHLVCGALVVAWVLALIRARAGQHPSPWPALFAGGVWLLHPLLLGTVLYTVQRMTILSALFTVAGMLLYVQGRTLQRQGSGTLRIVLAFAVCLPLAMLSKENGVLMIPLCAAHEWLLFRGEGTLLQRRGVRALFGVLLVLPLLAGMTVLGPMVLHSLAQGYALRSFTLSERLLTESRVLVFYLAEWLLPVPSQLSFFHDDIAVSRGLLAPWTTAPSIAVLAGVTLAAWRVRRASPLLSLGWLIFLIGHSLEGSIVPLELAFEHRNYVPTMGLAMALATLPWRAWMQRILPGQPAPRILLVLAALLLLLLAALTAQRSDDWGDAARLYPRLYAAAPGSPRLTALFSDAYANAGRFDEARAVLGHQDTVGARLQGADIDCLARRPADPAALAEVLAGVRGVMGTYEVQEIVHLANDVLEQRCGLPMSWGVALLDRALSLPITQASSRQLLWLYRAHIHHALGELATAQEDLAHSAVADPDNPLPLLLAADWALEHGDRAAARAHYEAAARVQGAHAAEYADLLAGLGARLRKPER